MYTYRTSRALQEERYLSPSKADRTRKVDVGSDRPSQWVLFSGWVRRGRKDLVESQRAEVVTD